MPTCVTNVSVGSCLNRLSENCHSEASAEESRSLIDCYDEILRFTQNDKINILRILGQPVVFVSYGGAYESLIEEKGFKLEKMGPCLSEKQLSHVRKALSGETLNTVGYFTAEEMQPGVENEIKLFQEMKPACMLTGWRQSVLGSTIQ